MPGAEHRPDSSQGGHQRLALLGPAELLADEVAVDDAVVADADGHQEGVVDPLLVERVYDHAQQAGCRRTGEGVWLSAGFIPCVRTGS